MKVFKKTAVLFAAFAVTAFSVSAFTAYAENETAIETTNETEEAADASQETIISGDYSYSVSTGNSGDEVAVLEEYLGNDTDVVIPETIDGYKVEALGNHTFADNPRITSISIPSGLENFGIYTFYGCTSVNEYKVSDKNENFRSDNDGALVDKKGLSIVAYPTAKNPESYTVPEGVVMIGPSAFAMCTNLKEITFPDSLEVIGDFAFSECTSLESVELPENLTELKRFAFSTCDSLSSVKFSESLEIIGDAAFFNCKALESVTFPYSVYEIGQAAFCSTGLSSVTIPSTVSSIGYSAFGFKTNYEDTIIQDQNFVIEGYNNSQAERYSYENDIAFVSLGNALDDPAYQESQKAKKAQDEESKISASVIAAICAASAAAIAVVVFVIIKLTGKKRGNDNNTDGSNEDNGEYTEDNE